MRVLFVPGLNCTPAIWEHAAALPWLEALTPAWPTEGIRSMDDAGRWLAEQIEATDAQAVVGHSLGGTTTLHLFGQLERRPLLPLVIVDSFMVTPHPMFRNHVWNGPEALEVRVRAMLDAQRPRYLELHQVAWAFEEDAAWIDAAVGTGATFVYGGRDETEANVVATRAGMPEHGLEQVRLIPGTSHFLMLEQPDAFHRVLVEAIGQQARAPAR